MKYLSKFNELKSSVYADAAKKLAAYGHYKRSNQLKDYSDLIKDKEEIKKILAQDSNNLFLQDPDNNLEGVAYLYDSNKKVWTNIGTTSAKISGIWLNTDLMIEFMDELQFPEMEIKLYLDFRIDLSNLNIDSKYYRKKDLKWSNFSSEITLGASLLDSKKWLNEFSFIDEIDIIILFNRKGLRGLNKMMKKYLTTGFNQKVKWFGESEGNFIDSELYSVPDYLYNLFDLQLNHWIEKEMSEISPQTGQRLNQVPDKMKDCNENFDDYFREIMERFKAPRVYYRLYRDDFPMEVKNIGLE